MGKIVLLAILFLLGQLVIAQQYTWTGDGGNIDFFDENNWLDKSSNHLPPAGSIEPNSPINLELLIGAEATVEAINGINLGEGTLTLENAHLSAAFILNGKVVLNNKAYLDIENEQPLQGDVQVAINSHLDWIRAFNQKPESFNAINLSRITFMQEPAAYISNIRLDNYYSNGTVIRSNSQQCAPLSLFDQQNLNGNSTQQVVNHVYSGNAIPGNMNNRLASFKLKRGYMATMAVNNDGTGLSQVFIASETDLVVNTLPAALQNNVSFIRVVPWNWVEKKGTGGDIAGMANTWFYQWGNSNVSDLQREYAPMAWGKNAANDDEDIALYRGKYKSTHVLAFNESDNCNDQSGKWGNLCDTDVAVETYQNLMKTGLRLVSPSCRENAPFGWLKEFYDKASAQNIRIDVIGVHWYDWSSQPLNSPNEDPQEVFKRFKAYLNRVHDLYGLPIWITEFNANPNRTTAVNKAFMELALPYLEELNYVERYAWYQPDSEVAEFYDEHMQLTEVGLIYKNMASSPSIGASVLASQSNLSLEAINDPSLVYADTFEGYANGTNLNTAYTVWNGPATTISDIEEASWGFAYQGNGFASTNSAQKSFYLRKTFQLEAGKTYEWSLATKAPAGSMHIMQVHPTASYGQLELSNSEWTDNKLTFTVNAIDTEITLALYRYSTSTVLFDNFRLRETGVSTELAPLHGIHTQLRVYPNPTKSFVNIHYPDTKFKGVLLNARGQTIRHFENTRLLNVSGLLNGIYFIKINNECVRFIKL